MTNVKTKNETRTTTKAHNVRNRAVPTSTFTPELSRDTDVRREPLSPLLIRDPQTKDRKRADFRSSAAKSVNLMQQTRVQSNAPCGTEAKASV
mmetsp:Transcript_12376/g.34071  ORF Transcript_12376/g.34071 Transcript_12376/m.34071 type:complete len:93 (+) Transcript_12376:980-1258(+)